MVAGEPNISVRVAAISDAAGQIRTYELVPCAGATLPSFGAGAHISVSTPNGVIRDYSLINPTDDVERYVIAVKREAAGSGGSLSIYDEVQVDGVLQISEPKNYFELVAEAKFNLLIAGGIGITPILSMVRTLESRGAPYRLIYLNRAPEATAFLAELSDPLSAPNVLLHYDAGDPDKSLDLVPAIGQWRDGHHLYCCGPQGLMRAVQSAVRDWPSGNVHFEDFGTTGDAPDEGNRPFEVELARSGRTILVGADESIAEALDREGIEVAVSCESGTCGTCMTKLLAGVVDHRDYVLDEDDQRDFIMICVSRAAEGKLRLDV